MQYVFLYVVLFFSLPTFPSAITYELNGGRFGDNLSTFCKAQFFCYKTKLPPIYKEFEYSNQLGMHHHKSATHNQAHHFSKTVRVNTIDDITKNDDGNTLFISHFYSQTPGIYEYCLQDPVFDVLIKKMLTPIAQLPTLEKREGTFTVGLHVRKGGGFDKPLGSIQIYDRERSLNRNNSQLPSASSKGKPQYADQIWPTKFPPDQYYLDQLKMLRLLVGPEQMLIVYLFTDDPNPGALAERYQAYLQDPRMEFVYRANANTHDSNIIEDFYVMAQCDYLIRSTSLYAKAAQLLGAHAIILFPQHGYWDVDRVIINPLGISIRS